MADWFSKIVIDCNVPEFSLFLCVFFVCLFLCLYKPDSNRVDNGFGTMDLAGINFDDGAGNDDDALDASPRRKKRRRGGGLNNDERRMRYEMERQMLLAWISPKKVDLSSLSTLDQVHWNPIQGLGCRPPIGAAARLEGCPVQHIWFGAVEVTAIHSQGKLRIPIPKPCRTPPVHA